MSNILVVNHLQGEGLVSAWSSSFILPPEEGTRYLCNGSVYEVMTALQYLGDSRAVGGNKLSAVLRTLFAPDIAATLFARNQHLPKSGGKFTFTLEGRTPGLPFEPDQVIYLDSKLVHQGTPSASVLNDLNEQYESDEQAEATAIIELEGRLYSCRLENLPMKPHRGSRFLRGGTLFEIVDVTECFGRDSRGQSGELIKLFLATHDATVPPTVTSFVRPLDETGLLREPVSSLPTVGARAKRERVVYLLAKRIPTVSQFGSLIAAVS